MPVKVTLKAKTMEGAPAADPSVRIEVTQTTPIQRMIASEAVPNFAGECTVVLPDTDEFPTWRVNVYFSRYDAVSGFNFMPRGNSSPTFEMALTRMPTAWKPQFTPLHSLPTARFRRLLDVIAVSNDVDLKSGPTIGDLNAKYDALTDSAQLQGKMALLNLYAVLADEKDPNPYNNVPWFNAVKMIVRIDQERFVAEVDAGMMESVEQILNGLNTTFKGQGYFTEPDSALGLHTPNIPPQYGAQNIRKMVTVKKDFEQGNLQLTLSHIVVGGRTVHLLDCDMDENRNLILHGLDVIKHLFNGGTSPVTMHEYIVEDSAQSNGGQATIDLGYRLV